MSIAAVARIKKLGGKSLNDRHEITPADPSKPQSYFEVKWSAPEESGHRCLQRGLGRRQVRRKLLKKTHMLRYAAMWMSKSQTRESSFFL
jgi:hypothetical protein